MPRISAALCMLSLATLYVPSFAQGTDPAVRDFSSTAALNYVQGQATLNGEPVTTSASQAPRALHAGETLATTSGSADVMLAPGSLLRLGQGTEAQIVAEDGQRAEVRLNSGHANVAVNTVRPHRLLLVDLPNGQTQIVERGLYTFDVPSQTVRVFNGEANEFRGADMNANVKPVRVKEGHEVVLTDPSMKPMKFDRDDSQDGLLPWTGAQETQAAIADGAVTTGAGYASTAFAGYGPGAYGFADGYGPGWGYPYGLYGYPFGFYGYPFGFGLGLGYPGGFYGVRRPIGHYPIGHGYGGLRGGYTGGVRGGFAGGGGFHGGGRR